jgi:hypothetical protein
MYATSKSCNRFEQGILSANEDTLRRCNFVVAVKVMDSDNLNHFTALFTQQQGDQIGRNFAYLDTVQK